MTDRQSPIEIRLTRPEDFPGVTALCRAVYPGSPPWTERQLASHLEVFADGQLVAAMRDTGRVVGMAASLIIVWDDYERQEAWRDITDGGTFRNHDPSGRTLYGAEVMVHPTMQRRRIGKRLYQARRDLATRLSLPRIRAGARLRGYHRYAAQLSAEEYAVRVVRGRLRDPTLSFQLREGFRVFGVVGGYLKSDPDSLGYAALIEWLNPAVATSTDSAYRDPVWARVPHRKRPRTSP